MIARMECSRPTELAPLATIYPTVLAPNARDCFLPRAGALLIRVAALLASASFSKSNNAEYLRPTTCAITLKYRAGYRD
jgi:hypothetical protein